MKSSSLKTARIPPPAPDVPSMLIPPPAPRPARLPTPELPEVDSAKMFPPILEAKYFHLGVQDSCSRPAYSKMNAQSKLSASVDNMTMADQNSGSSHGVHARDETAKIVSRRQELKLFGLVKYFGQDLCMLIMKILKS